MVSVDSEKCTGCGVCVSVCPVDVFKVINGKASVNDEDCIVCKNCETSCPTGAISV